MILDHASDELLDDESMRIECVHGCDRGANSRCRENYRCYGVPRTHAQEPMSLRCECSAMSMPKPANKVTMEVPP